MGKKNCLSRGYDRKKARREKKTFRLQKETKNVYFCIQKRIKENKRMFAVPYLSEYLQNMD